MFCNLKKLESASKHAPEHVNYNLNNENKSGQKLFQNCYLKIAVILEICSNISFLLQ